VNSALINCHHLNYNLFEIMTLALKKQGLMIFAGSYSSWGTFWYTEVLRTMVQEGRLEFIEDELYTTFGGISSGPGRFYKSQGKTFVYKNTQQNKKTWVTRTEEKFFEKIQT
jgi:hypothetical protein